TLMRMGASDGRTDVDGAVVMHPPARPAVEDLRAALDAADTPYQVATYLPKDVIFRQGNASDSVIYVERGSVRLTVTASNGKEATLGLLGPGAFLGGEGIVGPPERPAT